MESESKIKLLKGKTDEERIKNVEGHGIFDRVSINKISKIVSQLSKEVTLDQILSDFKWNGANHRFKRKNSNKKWVLTEEIHLGLISLEIKNLYLQS